MSAQPIPPISPEEYIEGERQAEYKSQYYNGKIYAMSGGSFTHGLIIFNIGRELGNALLDTPCATVGSDVRLCVSPTGLYTYPDVLVVCGEVRYVDLRRDTIMNPTVIVEILSPSTEASDRGFKFAQYRTIETLQEYVLVSQTEPRIEKYRRDGNEWRFTECTGLDTICEFASVNCKIPMARIYHRVTFEPV